MQEAVIRYFRELLKQDFPNAGEIEGASIFVERVGKKMINCGNTGNYMQLYLDVAEDRIMDIRYLCSLVKGKTLEEAELIRPEAFYRLLGSSGPELQIKVRGLLSLLNEGISFYRGQEEPGAASAATKRDWDWKPSP